MAFWTFLCSVVVILTAYSCTAFFFNQARCALACNHESGYVLSANSCSCVRINQTDSPCPDLRCPQGQCRTYKTDQDGCPTCQCQCPPVSCPAQQCRTEYITDNNGCRRCRCYKSTAPDCRFIPCGLRCPNGFARDSQGCVLCKCAAPRRSG